jgi:Protein of Unknown function (DUF2784)
VVADLVVVLHFLFVMFVVLGALVAIIRPRVMWLHIPAVAWAVMIELTGGTCPLTPIENELRHREGLSGYEGDFIAHHILRVLYPEQLTRTEQVWLGFAALAGNIAIYTLVWKRHSAWRAPRLKP